MLRKTDPDFYSFSKFVLVRRAVRFVGVSVCVYRRDGSLSFVLYGTIT